MTAQVSPPLVDVPVAPRARSLRYLVPIGRVFLSLIFIISSVGNFSSSAIGYAAAHGVPAPSFFVPLAGVLALVGGLSILFGFRTRLGAVLLVLFLVPVTLFMHRFWAVADPQRAMIDQVMFMKNVSILGGVLLLLYFGGGPMSMDVRRRTRPA
jgi:putative oxidoreductase